MTNDLARTNQTKKLGELIPPNFKNSSTDQLQTVHSKIITAVQTDSGAINERGVMGVVAYVVAMHGLKTAPTDTEITILTNELKTWFGTKINIQELKLAFGLNLAGELGEVFNPFGTVTFDFISNVVRAYLLRKTEAIKQQRTVFSEPETPQPVHNFTEINLRSLLADREAWEQDPEATILNIGPKRELLSQLFEMDITEKNIATLRSKAAVTVVRSLVKKKSHLPVSIKTADESKARGSDYELTHQIARLQAGKLITERDEQLIQYQVSVLLVKQVFESYAKEQFTNHIHKNLKGGEK